MKYSTEYKNSISCNDKNLKTEITLTLQNSYSAKNVKFIYVSVPSLVFKIYLEIYLDKFALEEVFLMHLH